MHRITNDLDALSADARALVEPLIDAGATQLAAAKLELAGRSSTVQVDVMGDTLTTGAGRLRRRLPDRRTPQPAMTPSSGPSGKGSAGGCSSEPVDGIG